METNRIYFYTATILHWRPILFDNGRKKIILNSLNWLVQQRAVNILAYVIMPNHIHVIWKPLIHDKIKNLQLSFMRFTGQQLLFHLKDSNYQSLSSFVVNKKDRQHQIWQRNPLSVELYSRKVLEQKLDYIHNNPVQKKWMLADSPIAYEFSSAKYYESDYLGHPFLTHYMDEI